MYSSVEWCSMTSDVFWLRLNPAAGGAVLASAMGSMVRSLHASIYVQSLQVCIGDGGWVVGWKGGQHGV
eukprot:m.123914 g.123914  ORF g.123914 m.123914 type:complete len:69 (-) comp15687_c0_seq17:2290-2496(-)